MVLDPDRYRLPAARVQAIFRDDIQPTLFADVRPPVGPPTLIIFGGQPGAGKSAAVGDAMDDMRGRGGAACIVGDELRDYNPHYHRLLAADDKTAAAYTDRDTALWIEAAIAHAKTAGVNVVLESTMRQPDVVARTMAEFRVAGYQVEVRALAVNRQFSEQGILERYEAQKLYRGVGRMTTEAAHGAAYDGLPLTIAAIERDGLADRISLYRRGGEEFYRSDKDARGGWSSPVPAAVALEQERCRPLTETEHNALRSGYDKLIDLLQRPDRQASMGELSRVIELRDNAEQQRAHDAPSKEITPMDKQKQRLVVMNGFSLLQAQGEGGSWTDVKPPKGSPLKPGFYNLYAAPAADTTKAYVGPILHKDDDAVYQQVGTALVKHAPFAEAPEVGATCAIKYEGSRALVTTDATAIRQSRGHSR